MLRECRGIWERNEVQRRAEGSGVETPPSRYGVQRRAESRGVDAIRRDSPVSLPVAHSHARPPTIDPTEEGERFSRC